MARSFPSAASTWRRSSRSSARAGHPSDPVHASAVFQKSASSAARTSSTPSRHRASAQGSRNRTSVGSARSENRWPSGALNRSFVVRYTDSIGRRRCAGSEAPHEPHRLRVARIVVLLPTRKSDAPQASDTVSSGAGQQSVSVAVCFTLVRDRVVCSGILTSAAPAP